MPCRCAGYDEHVRKITPDGTVTTLAGTAGVIGSADGIGAAARFSYPTGLAADEAGNLYVADRNISIIRNIDSAGKVSTLAGVAGNDGSTDARALAEYFPCMAWVDCSPSATVPGHETITYF